MTTEPKMLSEIRDVVVGGGTIDEQTFRRLMLAAIADIYERDEQTRKYIDNEITKLSRRDWWVLVAAAVVALLNISARFIP